MQNKNTKIISVLLTRYTDRYSRFFQIITNGEYTHASIGIEEYDQKFFSFIAKSGFYIERPINSTRVKKRQVVCALYHLEVTEDAYAIVKERIEDFIIRAEQYRYSFLGLLLCYLKVPHRFGDHYFCSQFVAELLLLSGFMQLRKQSSLYFPDDFIIEPQLKLCFQGTLGGLGEFLSQGQVSPCYCT